MTMRRRAFLETAAAGAVAVPLWRGQARAQAKPVRIGYAISATGPYAVGRRHHPGAQLHALAGPGERARRPRGQGRGAPADRVRLDRRPQRDRDRGALLREARHRRQGGPDAAAVGLGHELRDRAGGHQARLPDDRPHRDLGEVQGAGPALLLHHARAARATDAGGGGETQRPARAGQDQEDRGGLRQRPVRHRAERGHRPRLQGGRARGGRHQELPARVKDLSPVLRGFKAAGADAFVGLTYPPDNILVTGQAKEVDCNPAVWFTGVGTAFPFYRDRSRARRGSWASRAGIPR